MPRPRNRPNETASRVLNRLRLAEGAHVSVRTLEDAAFGHRRDGGPEHAEKIVRLTIYRLRKRGFPIKTTWSRGYHFAPTLWEVPIDAIPS